MTSIFRNARAVLVGSPLVFAMALSGCSKDDDVLAFVKENDALVEQVKSAKTGTEAKAAFDAKKGDLKSKYDNVKEARGFQVKQENMTKLTESVTKGVTAICMLKLKGKDYDSLCNDYTNTLK